MHRVPSLVRSLAFTVVALALAATCAAWNKPGHMVTGAIAYADLGAVDPAARDEVVAALKEHPEYLPTWKPMFASLHWPAEDEGLFLFMEAARWPDDARDTPDDHPTWHYINRPFVPPGQPGWVTPNDPPSVNVLTAIRDNRAAFETGSGVARSKALCWLFHLVGDSHQPLHAATLFSTRHRDGDRGGTRYYVRSSWGGRTTSLHALWDGFLIGSSNPQKVRNRATAIRAEVPMTALPVGVSDESAWLDESFALAVSEGYRNGDVSGSADEDNGRVLPAGYSSGASRVAVKRARLAGARLAELLREMVAP